MSDEIHLYDVVALTESLSGRALARGQVGTVVETLAPGVFEVEYLDKDGKTYALVALKAEQLLVLRHEPASLE